MRILFDFGHPADVHYFKNLIHYLNEKNHAVQILARDKDVSRELLSAYHLSFLNKGTGGHGFFDRAVYTVKSLHTIYNQFKQDPPDLCISHASPYLAVMAATWKIPHIMFNDTEKAVLFDKIVRWCKPDVYVPDCFLDDHQIPINRIPSYMELAYLHPELFQPDKSIREITGDNYILLRFVSNWATHDFGHTSLRLAFKRKLIKKIEKSHRIWISSEKPLPDDLKKYEIPLAPDKIHDVIASSEMVIGDSATVSSEAAVLGIPAVHIHQNRWGYLKELEEKYNLVHHFKNDAESRESACQTIQDILENDQRRLIYAERRKKMLKDKMNMTELMIQIVEKKLSAILNVSRVSIP